MSSLSRAAAALLAGALPAVLAGCGGGSPSAPDAPPDVTVAAGPQEVAVQPTQYCGSGEGLRYDVTPPVVEVSPDTPIALTVPDDVAAHGWSVQVFDERLEEKIGEVDVEVGTTTFDGINSSDVVPPAYYLVVVEDAHGECLLTGSWPVGFLRAGGEIGADPTG
ncbi:hypothetical protein GCM10027451_00360 [Geodermatophilus aquaeductus]|uniref:DUF2771 domain-containing protein n=1 Tax=Geodermatophilus aquaeductus TaxID=1564161 RepID=A0A521CTJ8_9ACTN|nr:DUF2771 family protein [Geodermatophilus aquaeductus]SMO62776.1 Protein of unknown function [Geodermatophilus aquaeductus]